MTQPKATTDLASLLAGEEQLMNALARGQVEVWQPLLEALSLNARLSATPELEAELWENASADELALWQPALRTLRLNAPLHAGPAFMEAALRRNPSFEAWLRLAQEAASQCDSRVFSTATHAARAWSPWFFGGLAQVREASSPEMLGARFSVRLRASDDEDELSLVRDLVADARRSWSGDPRFPAILQLLHRRAGEAGAHAEALQAIREAETLYAAASDTDAAAFARRLQGTTLLQLRRFDEAWSLLDVAMQARGPLFGGGGSFRSGGSNESPLERALQEAAAVATWATPADAEWVRAVGAIAETLSSATPEEPAQAAELWRRFDRCLNLLLGGNGAETELETVIRQAEERGMTATVDRAERRARASPT
jgi:hypothetical protein